ncbi:MAG: hypothetical protein ABEJ64_03475 [Candidatus Nanohaloarchaea archaeon]
MKGVSEVVSAVIVLAVGVSVVSLYAAWAPDFAEDTVGDVANQSNNQIKCSNAGLSIDDAFYDRTGQVIEIKVENTGTIRFSRGLYAGAFNSSLEIGRTTISELQVGETQTVQISADRAPGMVLVTSNDCPDVEARETRIRVQK